MKNPSPTLRRAGLEIAAASFVVLFQELALIRWLPAQVRVIAYFPNLILISSFLGLGIGALRGRKKSMLWLWPLLLAVVVGVAIGLSRIAFTADSVSEHLWLLYYDLGPDAVVIDGVRLPIILLFVLSASTFVPLGQFVGERLDRFRSESSSLWGYSLDLLGSLLGVIVFAVVSFIGMWPVTWFASIGFVGVLVIADKKRLWAYYGVAMIAIVLAVQVTERATDYSPYYALATDPTPEEAGFGVVANGSLHQRALNVVPPPSGDDGAYALTRTGYHFPLRAMNGPRGRALVLGAGTGNDVATLLDEGFSEVHAVEIDPVILRMGRDHPNRPYDSDRVTVFNQDGRAFLRDTEYRYDLIVFGTLDSMTRLSALSSVRLDNFVYTREAIEAAASRLTPEGGLVLYFMIGETYIYRQLYGMLASTFEVLPAVHQTNYALFNTIFASGPAFAHLSQPTPEEVDAYYNVTLPSLDLPTDDWPYLYLPERGVSGFYLSLMATFLLIAVVGVLVSSREMREGLLQRGEVDWEMLLFGLAFLLIETKFVTTMNLVWGATWLTSAVVFGSILATILIGTVLMELRPIPWTWAATGLVLALFATYWVPTEALAGRSTAVRLMLSVLVVGGPIFFASVCFALRFRVRPAADIAFGWNLLGAVAGGLLEFLSMSLGLRALTLIAIVAYLIAFLIRSRALEPQVAAAPVPGDGPARVLAEVS
jgi:spermidine synthase